MFLLVAVGCSSGTKNSSDAGDASGDGGDGFDSGDAPADTPFEPYRFTTEMEAHMVAAEADGGTTVCCDSQTGCFTSDAPGVCSNDGSVPLGTSFRFWFLQSSGGVSLSIQTSEPPTGFTGACLLGPDGRPADHVQLPAVCFSPSGNVQYGVATTTEVIVRAAEVLQSDTPPPPDFDDYPYSIDYNAFHYQVLMTCYPKGAGGACPTGSSAVSSSCCNVGSPMTYLYVNLAHGFVDLTSN
jgi:hypothetical protein